MNLPLSVNLLTLPNFSLDLLFSHFRFAFDMTYPDFCHLIHYISVMKKQDLAHLSRYFFVTMKQDGLRVCFWFGSRPLHPSHNPCTNSHLQLSLCTGKVLPYTLSKQSAEAAARTGHAAVGPGSAW